MGPAWCAYRAFYQFKRRAGLLQRDSPAKPWEQWPYPGAQDASPPTSSSRRPGIWLSEPERAVAEAKEIERGAFLLFGHHWVEAGCPPDWHVNPLTGRRLRSDLHWSALEDLDSAQGDIKYVWELSRFRWALVLAAADRQDGDPRWGELFWRLWEDWRDRNPPNLGPNWMCGQEVALRLIALVQAFHQFSGHRASTARRVESLRSALAVHGSRIEANIDYAISQCNNHGISEAAGLLTAGLECAWHPDSTRWVRQGCRVLEEEILRQFYTDGSYVQHSLVYERLALEDCLWALEVAGCHGLGLSPVISTRLEQACRFLEHLIEPQTGHVPNYGANDGSYVFGAAVADPADFRPIVKALKRALGLPDGGGHARASGSVTELRRRTLVAAEGGYYSLPGTTSWAMVRCHSYRHRPSQADMLHLDLWVGRRNLLADSGTYSYNAPAPWGRYFASTAAHNTVEVDEQDQMERGPRFLWFHWTRSRVLECSTSAASPVQIWSGEHEGYCRLTNPVRHRRRILRCGDRWCIVDDLAAEGRHRFVLRWHLDDDDWIRDTNGVLAQDSRWRLELASPADAELHVYRGQTVPRLEGWSSRCYGVRQERAVLLATVDAPGPVRFITFVYPLDGAAAPELELERVVFPGEAPQRIDLLPAPDSKPTQ
ncbi:MAG: alginate lyase family protein [Candidatus Wallbacteria bacterium]|nr:alginate lyase family protein [Candidatus Wallbacteria bacterium]